MINIDHRVGFYCKSTALSNLLRAKNIDINEALVFGISQGLDFCYSRPLDFNGGKKIISIFGGTINDFYNFSDIFGLVYKTIKPRNNQEYIELIRNYVANNTPIIATVSLMDYYSSLNKENSIGSEYVSETDSLFEMLDTSIGNHVTTIVDIDNEFIYLYENTLNNLQKVKIQEFLLASNPKKFSIMHPKNELHVFEYLNKVEINLKEVIVEAIRQNYTRFLNSTTEYSGIKSLESFKNDFIKWPKILKNHNNLKNSIKMFYYFCEVATGGGFYRKLYSQFLKNASKILSSEELLGYSKRYFSLSMKWRKFSRKLLACDQVEDIFKDNDLIMELHTIIEEEKLLAHSLYDFSISEGGVECNVI